jgi:hypothetical protein
MEPYRTAAEMPRPRLAFGDPQKGRWSIVGGLLLVALTVAVVLLWSSSGGRMNGSVALPAIFGTLMILRARWGTMELRRDRDALAVTRRALWPTRYEEVPLAHVQTVEIVPVSWRQRKPDFALNLRLSGDRTVTLMRAQTMAALEPDRQAIAAFLVEHGLLWGGKKE